jgi:hypothetical protein
MTTHELRTRYTDLPLLGGQVVRVALELDELGEPASLRIALGWQEAHETFTPVDTLRLPAEVAGPLRDALAALLEQAA